MHIHNQRNFCHAKLNSEINARFLLNGHGDLYFLLHNNSVHNILLCFKKEKLKNIFRRKKRCRWNAQNRYSVTAKIMTLQTLYAHVALNSVMFWQMLNDFLLFVHFFAVLCKTTTWNDQFWVVWRTWNSISNLLRCLRFSFVIALTVKTK